MEEDEDDDEDERDLEDEGEGIVKVKLEEETSERTLSAAVSDVLPSASPQSWKKRDGAEERKGEFLLLVHL